MEETAWKALGRKAEETGRRLARKGPAVQRARGGGGRWVREGKLSAI
jgi:hypothetical protein